MLTSRVTALLFLTLACLIASCDTATDAPPDDSGTFRIVELLGDSLYGGEELRIVTSGAGEDTTALKVMLHSLDAEITGISGDTISIEIPRGAESGIIKLYKHDSILAAGEHSITIIPQHVDDLVPQGIDVRHLESFPGDTLTFVFQDLPMTDRPIEITLNGSELSFMRHDPDTLRVRVPDDATTGELRVRLFDRNVLLRTLKIATETELLAERTIRNITFSAYAVWASMEQTTKTPTAEAVEVVGSTLDAATIIDAPPGTTVVQSGDTLIIEGSQFDNGFAWRMQARLIPSGANKWSGRISCMKIENYGAWNAAGASFCIEMNNMRFKREEGKYILYALGDDIKQHVTDLCFQHLTTSGGYGFVLYLVKFLGNHHRDSKLEIMLEP